MLGSLKEGGGCHECGNGHAPAAMTGHESAGRTAYGNPHRGYAGAYWAGRSAR